jgi:hypothetical protein
MILEMLHKFWRTLINKDKCCQQHGIHAVASRSMSNQGLRLKDLNARDQDWARCQFNGFFPRILDFEFD